MTGASTKLTAAVETWFAEFGRLRASGGATGERSSYGPLAKLLDAVGATLKPKVFCVVEPVNQGAGHPDFGLYTSKQVQKGRPRKGQLPERGVVEVKSPREDTQARMVREQASRYWGRYRLVLVTNLREFALVGPDAAGGEATLESYRLAESEAAFARMLERPRASARTAAGAGLGALAGARVKRAATEREFGFEFMPAPFVVAHLQVGPTMQYLDAPLADDGTERAGVFLTSALTGWEPRSTKPLPFPELEEERDRRSG